MRTQHRRLLGELIGSAALATAVIGSGIMATNLSSDVGLQLLQNSYATALALAVLIAVLGPVSGAHFNPVVSLAERVLDREARSPGETGTYIGVQVLGCSLGAVLANMMFDLAPVTIATTDRADLPRLLAEVLATAGLVTTIFVLVRAGRASLVAPAVGAYIGAAYYFTSSTSFANPAITIGRMLSDTFAGIAPASAVPFIAAQLVGGAVAVAAVRALAPARVLPIDGSVPEGTSSTV